MVIHTKAVRCISLLTRVIGELHTLLLGMIKSCSSIRLVSAVAPSGFKSGNRLGACLIGLLFPVFILCSTKVHRPISPLYLEKASTCFESKDPSAAVSFSPRSVFDALKRSSKYAATGPCPSDVEAKRSYLGGVSIHSFVSFSLEWPMASVATISIGSHLAASVPE